MGEYKKQRVIYISKWIFNLKPMPGGPRHRMPRGTYPDAPPPLECRTVRSSAHPRSLNRLSKVTTPFTDPPVGLLAASGAFSASGASEGSSARRRGARASGRPSAASTSRPRRYSWSRRAVWGVVGHHRRPRPRSRRRRMRRSRAAADRLSAVRSGAARHGGRRRRARVGREAFWVFRTAGDAVRVPQATAPPPSDAYDFHVKSYDGGPGP